jgi:NarL family two-component system response regulator LiaR
MPLVINRSLFLHVLGYGAAMAMLVLLLRWMEIRFFILDHSTEIYVGGIALIFTGLGMWLAHQLTRPKEVVVEKITFIEKQEIDPLAIEMTGLSKRELEILQMMARGMSNQEMGDTLFISLSTVKTHVASIFSKLKAVRRTQAIEIAKSLKIIT